MPKIAAIAPEGVALGFQLAGVEVMTTASAEATQEALFQRVRGRGYGLVVVPQEHFATFEAKTVRQLEEWEAPLVLPVPMTTVEAMGDPRAYLSEIVRRAIGYQIKI